MGRSIDESCKSVIKSYPNYFALSDKGVGSHVTSYLAVLEYTVTLGFGVFA